mmetsp:Transcript_17731/g.30014  ORF Transcript_17731/g.30014 Transcript_17731/m.30014 type:complete len:121 (+) Transcript_17731:12-374(+)
MQEGNWSVLAETWSYLLSLLGERTPSVWQLTLGASLSLFLYLFGVPQVRDPLLFYYKADSSKVKKVIEGTQLKNMAFTTCLAGTVYQVQMFTMLVVEAFYHKFYNQVKLHREIFKFKDGG